MEELVMKAARELGIDQHVPVKAFAGSADPLVTVAFPPRAQQRRIPVRLLMEDGLTQVKTILSDMTRAVKT
jgi:hypothetical protein